MSSKPAAFALIPVVFAAAAALADTREIVNPQSAYPEGPVVVGSDVYYAEMGANRVMRWDGKANTVVWTRPGCGPTSVARGGGDTLIVLCHIEEKIARITTAGDTVAIIDRDTDGNRFRDPNASINDARGGVYISSSGDFAPGARSQGAVLYLAADGTLRRLAEQIHYANGVALSPDGSILYVSEHLSRRILAYDVAADGSLSGTRVFLKLDDILGKDPKRAWWVGPDGLSVDQGGNLYMAEYGGGRIVVVDRDAKLRFTMDFPEMFTTAPVLTNGDERIFITAPVSFDNPTAFGKVYSVANPFYGKD